MGPGSEETNPGDRRGDDQDLDHADGDDGPSRDDPPASEEDERGTGVEPDDPGSEPPVGDGESSPPASEEETDEPSACEEPDEMGHDEECETSWENAEDVENEAGETPPPPAADDADDDTDADGRPDRRWHCERRRHWSGDGHRWWRCTWLAIVIEHARGLDRP